MKKEVALGIDMGGTNTAFGFIDREGNYLAEGNIATNKHSDIQDYLHELHEAIEHALDSIRDEVTLVGIGIGAPCGNYLQGTIENASNLNWKGIIPDNMYKGQYVPNEILNQYYSSAKIVLNDHRPDMKKHGFINNRIYDAKASGTLVISDYIKEIDDIYKGSVPMYQTKEELKHLLNYYLNNEEERQELAKKAQEITLKEFTNTAVAKKILSHITK
jgi:spore maturation protein CgeB